jgi:hypothetical protein
MDCTEVIKLKKEWGLSDINSLKLLKKHITENITAIEKDINNNYQEYILVKLNRRLENEKTELNEIENKIKTKEIELSML